jgi:hypothetical protein
MKIKHCVGYAIITDSVEITIEELKKYNNRHQSNDFLEENAQGRKTLFAWVLDDVRTREDYRPYSYSTGSWCKHRLANS